MPSTKKLVETEQFSITLSRQAVDFLERLVDTGLYGNSRGEVARTLICARLEELIVKGIVEPKK